MSTEPKQYTLEHHYKLYDNSSGKFTSIGPDDYGPDVCVIKQGINVIVLPKKVIPMFVSALHKWADSLECVE
jgi:hypothetical protein